MKKYMLKRILFSIFSLLVVVMVVMLLVYTCIPRSVIFQTDDIWNKTSNNDRAIYEYNQYSKYGYLSYVDYSSFLKQKYSGIYGEDYINRDDYKKDLAVIQKEDQYRENESVKEFLNEYYTKGYTFRYLTPVRYSDGELKPGGKGYLLAIDEKTFDVEAAVAKMPTREQWEEMVKKGYGEAAPEAFKAQKNKSFDRDARRKEIGLILASLPKLREKYASFLPTYKELARKLKAAGAPYVPSQLHVTREELMDSVLYAKEVRSKYTSLWIADALGLLPEMAVALADDAEALEKELG